MTKFLTVKDIMQILQISRSKAYSLMNTANFPSIKIGKCLRISENDFFSWLQKNKKML